MSDNIIILKLQNRGMPGTGVSEIEKSQILADILALEERPHIITISDLSDVDMNGIVDGNVLVWNDAAQTLEPGAIAPGLAAVVDDEGNEIQSNTTRLQFGYYGTPLRIEPHPTVANRAVVQVAVGSTPATVASGNHTHALTLPVRVTTAPSGYMSGGTRNVGSASVTLPDGIDHVIEASLYGQLRGADAGAAYYTVTINIGGSTYTSPGGSDGFWCVQGVPDKVKWEHERKMAGAGNSVAVTANIAFHSGAGLNVDRFYLRVRVRPER